MNEHSISQTEGDSPRVKLRIGKKLVYVPVPSEDTAEPLGGCGASKCWYDNRKLNKIPEHDMVNARFEDLEFKMDKFVERLNEFSKLIK